MVVVLVIASLTYLGWVPGLGQRGTGGGSQFTSARQAADSLARLLGSGAANLTWAAGFLSRVPVEVPANFTPFPLRGLGCSLTPSGPASRNLSAIPNVSTSPTDDWTFAYTNGSGDILLIQVTGNAAGWVATLQGAACPFAGPQFGLIPASVDDPAMVRTVAADSGGYEFLAQHPDSNVTLVLTSPRTSGPPSGLEWTITYSGCPMSASSPASGPAFQAEVDAVTGSLLTSQNATLACPWWGQVQTTPLASILGVTTAFESTQGTTHWYNFTIRSVTGNLPLNNLGVTVQDSLGNNLTPAGATLVALTSSGAAIGTFDFSSGVWASGGTRALVTGDQLVLQTSQALDGRGYWLVLVGQGYFTGTLSARIP